MRMMIPLIKKCASVVNKKPLFRGMAVYSITWPVSSIIQQSFDSKEYDYKRLLKFSLYGTFFVAPTLYGWMTFSCMVWPQNTLKYAIIKVLTENISYGPFSICCYFFGLTIMEGGDIDDGLKEVSNKFFPTWKVSVTVWPIVQTVNYLFIPEKNRVPFVSICGLAWTTFLAFVKYQEKPIEIIKD